MHLKLHKLTFTTAHFHVTTAQFVINCTLKYALFTCHGQIWPKSAIAKLPKNHLVLLPKKKNPASGTLLSPPFRPHLADRAQNFVNVVGP